ncbi:hypothetical protein ACJX0J_032673, partial [Zea mays]
GLGVFVNMNLIIAYVNMASLARGTHAFIFQFVVSKKKMNLEKYGDCIQTGSRCCPKNHEPIEQKPWKILVAKRTPRKIQD